MAASLSAVILESNFLIHYGKIPWRRVWQPTPVFLPGESHGQRSLVGYSPRGYKEMDTTEWLNIRKTKIMASGPITPWEIDGETVETVSDFIFGGSKKW